MTVVRFLRGACAGMTVALVVTVTGCYSPDLRNCAVTCSTEAECPDSQSCKLGYCVADDAVDCRIPPATAPDATPSTPPPERTALHITISGDGRIEIDGGGTCSSGRPQDGNCTIDIERGVAVTLHAIVIDHEFERWTTTPCLGDLDPTCQFTPSVPTLNLGVKFK